MEVESELILNAVRDKMAEAIGEVPGAVAIHLGAARESQEFTITSVDVKTREVTIVTVEALDEDAAKAQVETADVVVANIDS
jgi:hypothetical protein